MNTKEIINNLIKEQNRAKKQIKKEWWEIAEEKKEERRKEIKNMPLFKEYQGLNYQIFLNSISCEDFFLRVKAIDIYQIDDENYNISLIFEGKFNLNQIRSNEFFKFEYPSYSTYNDNYLSKYCKANFSMSFDELVFGGETETKAAANKLSKYIKSLL